MLSCPTINKYLLRLEVPVWAEEQCPEFPPWGSFCSALPGQWGSRTSPLRLRRTSGHAKEESKLLTLIRNQVTRRCISVNSRNPFTGNVLIPAIAVYQCVWDRFLNACFSLEQSCPDAEKSVIRNLHLNYLFCLWCKQEHVLCSVKLN